MNIPVRSYARAILEATADKGKAEIKEVVDGFLKLLSEQGKLSRAQEIISEIEKLDDEAEGIVRAHVTSAHKLDEESLTKLSTLIKKRSGAKEIVWEQEIDPKLLGGVIISYNDKVIDMSLRQSVETLAETIKK